jgi:hypothetical protein
LSDQVSKVDTSLKDMDWDIIRDEVVAKNVTEDNRAKLVNFVTNALSDLMTKLIEALAEHLSNLDNTYKFFKNILNDNPDLPNENGNDTNSDNMGRRILKFILNKITPDSENDNDDEKNNPQESKEKNDDDNNKNNVSIVYIL